MRSQGAADPSILALSAKLIITFAKNEKQGRWAGVVTKYGGGGGGCWDRNGQRGRAWLVGMRQF